MRVVLMFLFSQEAQKVFTAKYSMEKEFAASKVRFRTGRGERES